MKNKVLILLAIIIVIVSGVFVIYKSFVIKDKQLLITASPTSMAYVQPTTNTPETLNSLLASNTPKSCMFSGKDGQGSFYTQNGNIRVDFESNNNGQVNKSHMIIMDGNNYIWTEGQSTGIKLPFDINKVSTDSADPNSPLNPDTVSNYKCSDWTPDPVLFTLPKNVGFGTFAMPENFTIPNTPQPSP